MILKQIRLSRHYSQEQLAQMAGLNVRTIQRIESGQNASLESLKCLASALEVDVSTLKQEKFTMRSNSDHWQRLPFLMKCWFTINFLQSRPTRASARRVEIMSHIAGFLSCAVGLVHEAALIGGLVLLLNAYFFHLIIWQGDRYGIWYDIPNDN